MEEIDESDLKKALRDALGVEEIVDAPDALTAAEIAEMINLNEVTVRRRLRDNPCFEKVHVLRTRTDGKQFRTTAWRLKNGTNTNERPRL